MVLRWFHNVCMISLVSFPCSSVIKHSPETKAAPTILTLEDKLDALDRKGFTAIELQAVSNREIANLLDREPTEARKEQAR